MGYTKLPLRVFGFSQSRVKAIFSSNKVEKSQVVLLKSQKGTSLVVHWLRLCASTAEGMVSIPGQGTKDATLFMAVAKN